MRKMNPTATFRDITTAFHGKMVGERLLLQQEQSHLLRMAPERVAGVLTALQNHLSEHQVRNPRVIAFKDAIKGGKQLDINIQLGTIAELITHSEHRMHKRVKV
ncbi:hypothetical protein KJ765_02505 [Candidatus Micrarchaeota archaeon]|nr:hypothetical protein [Candidatus Micrarchaeota archaeon]